MQRARVGVRDLLQQVRQVGSEQVRGTEIARRRLIVAQRHLQLGLALGDGLHQALRGLAGGCGQRDGRLRRQAAGLRMLQQHQQHAHDGGGLAGTGATGKHEEARTGHGSRGGALPVGGAVRHAGEQRVQVFGQGGGGNRQRALCAALQDRGGEFRFMLPVAPQVEAILRVEHERGEVRAVADPCVLAQGLQRIGVEAGLGLRVVQPRAGMAMAFGVAGRARGGGEQGGAGAPEHPLRQGLVDRALVGFGGAVRRVVHAAASCVPAKASSSASISATGQWWRHTPCPGARPSARTNRYQLSPSWRSAV